MSRSKLKKVPLPNAALIAGVCLLIMTILSFAIFPSLQATIYSIIGILIIIILDVVVAIALYFLLKPVNKNLSLTMSICRFVYAIIFFIALCNISYLTTFHAIWDSGLLLFGFHLLLLGYLVLKSTYLPKWLGILVMIGSSGYILDGIGAVFGYPLKITMFTFMGEVLFAFWLVIKGRKLPNEILRTPH